MTAASSAPQPFRSDLSFRMPADSANVSLVRSLTAGIAARSGFTIEEVEDLRIAVGEACALVLEALEGRPTPVEAGDPAVRADLSIDYFLGPHEVTVAVSSPVVDDAADPARPPTLPTEESIAWQVLTSLTSRAEMVTRDGVFTVRLLLRSTLAPAAPPT